MIFKNRKQSCEKAVENALEMFKKACGIWTDYDESVSTGQCATCSHFDVNEMQSRRAWEEEQGNAAEETVK